MSASESESESDDGSAAGEADGDAGKSEYELLREANIARNNLMMQALGLEGPVLGQNKKANGKSGPGKAPPKRKRPETEPREGTRQSSRLQYRQAGKLETRKRKNKPAPPPPQSPPSDFGVNLGDTFILDGEQDGTFVGTVIGWADEVFQVSSYATPRHRLHARAYTY